MSKLNPKSFNYSFLLFSFLIQYTQSIETNSLPIKKRFKKNESNSNEMSFKTVFGFIGFCFLCIILFSCCYGIPCLLIRICIEKLSRRVNNQQRTSHISYNNNNNDNNNINYSEENNFDNNKLILKKKYYLFENIIFPQKVDDNTIENEICSICQEKFNLNKDICYTPCTHIFHHECLMNYLMKIIKSNCPNCNFDLLSSLDNDDIDLDEIIIPAQYEYINWKNKFNKKYHIKDNSINENIKDKIIEIEEDDMCNEENIEININDNNPDNNLAQMHKGEDKKSDYNSANNLNNNEDKNKNINNNGDSNKNIDNIEENNKEIINSETSEMNNTNNHNEYNKKIKMVNEK